MNSSVSSSARKFETYEIFVENASTAHGIKVNNKITLFPMNILGLLNIMMNYKLEG